MGRGNQLSPPTLPATRPALEVMIGVAALPIVGSPNARARSSAAGAAVDARRLRAREQFTKTTLAESKRPNLDRCAEPCEITRPSCSSPNTRRSADRAIATAGPDYS